MSWPYDPAAPVPLPEEEYRLLREFIRSRIGLDFGPSRRDILATRLKKRLEILSLRSFLEYYHYLLYAPKEQRFQEMETLADVLANHETYFFREAYQFDLLFDVFWDKIRASEGRPTRILSVGCSTGEEVYSLALSALERRMFPEKYIELIGVDLCRPPIDAARRGVYRPYSFRAQLPFPREKYFLSLDSHSFLIKSEVRSLVTFHQGNLLNALFMEKLGPVDAIFCRNVLIYFDDAAVARAAKIFHRVLRPGGFLFLGHSESFLGRGFPFEAVRGGQYIVYRSV